jgi:hypothetical protein
VFFSVVVVVVMPLEVAGKADRHLEKVFKRRNAGLRKHTGKANLLCGSQERA